MEKDQTTESRILRAANEVFVKKGFEGARMQEIADAAGINKSLLHYYFRNKDTLFSAVFTQAFQEIIPQINEVISSEASLLDKIHAFVEKYTAFLLEHPHLPLFILGEIQRNPTSITDTFKSNDKRIHEFIWQVLAETQQGKINPMPPEHIFVNILSLSVFPIIARPILQSILFNDDEEKFEKFIQERPEAITQFFRLALNKGTQQDPEP